MNCDSLTGKKGPWYHGSMLNKLVSVLSAILVMVVVAWHWHSAMFPEFAALSTGFILVRPKAWMQRTWDFALWPTIGAALALGIHHWLSSYALTAAIVFPVMLMALTVTNSPAIPALSVGLLVSILKVDSISYLISVLIFSTGLVFFAARPSPKHPPMGVFRLKSLTSWPLSIYGATMTAWIVGAFALHKPFLATPPLFVAAYDQLINPRPYRDTLRDSLFLALSAGIGAGVRVLMPLPIIPDMIALTMVLTLLIRTGRLLLPVLPLAILPSLMLGHQLGPYVLEVSIAAPALLTVGWTIRRATHYFSRSSAVSQ